MTEKIKYSESRVIHPRELVDRPGKPSQILREIEADVIGRLARSVALSDRQFAEWPRVELVTDYSTLYLRDQWTLRAEVVVK